MLYSVLSRFVFLSDRNTREPVPRSEETRIQINEMVHERLKKITQCEPWLSSRIN